jgi:glycosyltransferase involved in cell wall biosynthesis
MRLALISHGPPDDPKHFSGIPWHILQELRRQGHQVEPVYAEPAAWTRSWAKFKNRLSLKLYGQPHHAEADAWVLRTRSMHVDKKIRAFQPDVVLCAGFPEAAAALSPDFPLYIWMDALYPTVRRCYPYFRLYYSEGDARTLRHLENCVLQRAQKIWLSSVWAVQEAQADFPAAAPRMAVQSFGANLAEAPAAAVVEASLAKRNLAQPTLLFLANEWERKGGATAVETVQQLRREGCPAKLVVVGITERPTSLPAESWIEWVGRLDKRQPGDALRLQGFLSDSAFLLLPTTADCTPIVCHEAAAYGLPVLATAVGGLAATVDSGKTGQLWPVQNFAPQASAWLKDILADRSRYEVMARAARHRFETTGNWAVNVRAIAAEMTAGKN